MDIEIKQFVEERNEMLRSLDVDKAIAFHKKYNPNSVPSQPNVMEISIHKARVNCLRYD